MLNTAYWLEFGDGSAVCDELCQLVFSLIYTSDVDLPENSFISSLGAGQHTFLILHTGFVENVFFNTHLNINSAFETIEVFFEEHNAVIIDPWIWCVVPMENWGELKNSAEEFDTLPFFVGNWKKRWSKSLIERNKNKSVRVFGSLQNRFSEYCQLFKATNDMTFYRGKLEEAQANAKRYVMHYIDPNFTPFYTNENYKELPNLLRNLISKLIVATDYYDGFRKNFLLKLRGYLNEIFTENNYVKTYSEVDYKKLEYVFLCCVVSCFIKSDCSGFYENTNIADVLLAELNDKDKKMGALRYFLRERRIETKTHYNLQNIILNDMPERYSTNADFLDELMDKIFC